MPLKSEKSTVILNLPFSSLHLLSVPIIPEYLYQLEHRHVPVSLNTTTNTTPSSFVTALSSSFLERDKNLTRQSLKGSNRRTLTPTHKTHVRKPVASIEPPSPRLSLRVERKNQRKPLREPNDNEKRATVDLSDLKILQPPRWYRRLRSKRAFQKIDSVLVGGERRMFNEYFQEQQSEHKTQRQQIASKSNKSRFAKNEHILNDSPLEISPAKRRMLPSSQKYQTSEAPSSSEELKQTKITQDSIITKPKTASVSGVTVKEREMYKDIKDENWKVGMLLSSKALVQLMVNPMVGSLTTHIGYSLPLVFGTHNLLLSAICRYLSNAFIYILQRPSSKLCLLIVTVIRYLYSLITG